MRRVLACVLALLPLAASTVFACGGLELAIDAASDAASDAADAATKDVVVPPHRASATPCDASRPMGNAFSGLDSGCVTDTDCDAGVNGRCVGTLVCSTTENCEANFCSYDTCLSDDVCGGGACTCREDFPKAGNFGDQCDSRGDCRVDSDCVDGQFCSPSYVPGCFPPGYFCHTPKDECLTDADCGKNGLAVCGYDPTVQHWRCQGACIDG